LELRGWNEGGPVRYVFRVRAPVTTRYVSGFPSSFLDPRSRFTPFLALIMTESLMERNDQKMKNKYRLSNPCSRHFCRLASEQQHLPLTTTVWLRQQSTERRQNNQRKDEPTSLFVIHGSHRNIRELNTTALKNSCSYGITPGSTYSRPQRVRFHKNINCLLLKSVKPIKYHCL
jgi:hypothetical protein